MESGELLNYLDSIGVSLSVDNDELRVRASAGILTDGLKKTINEHRKNLVQLLQETNDLVEEAISLGGVVAGEVEEIPGELVTVVYDDGTIAVIGPNDEIPF